MRKGAFHHVPLYCKPSGNHLHSSKITYSCLIKTHDTIKLLFFFPLSGLTSQDKQDKVRADEMKPGFGKWPHWGRQDILFVLGCIKQF